MICLLILIAAAALFGAAVYLFTKKPASPPIDPQSGGGPGEEKATPESGGGPGEEGSGKGNTGDTKPPP